MEGMDLRRRGGDRIRGAFFGDRVWDAMPMTYHDLEQAEWRAYADLDEAAKSYPLIWEGSVLRFQRNEAVNWAVDHSDLNNLWRQGFPVDQMRQLYRLCGWSLDSYLDVFHFKEQQ